MEKKTSIMGEQVKAKIGAFERHKTGLDFLDKEDELLNELERKSSLNNDKNESEDVNDIPKQTSGNVVKNDCDNQVSDSPVEKTPQTKETHSKEDTESVEKIDSENDEEKEIKNNNVNLQSVNLTKDEYRKIFLKKDKGNAEPLIKFSIYFPMDLYDSMKINIAILSKNNISFSNYVKNIVSQHLLDNKELLQKEVNAFCKNIKKSI